VKWAATEFDLTAGEHVRRETFVILASLGALHVCAFLPVFNTFTCPNAIAAYLVLKAGATSVQHLDT